AVRAFELGDLEGNEAIELGVVGQVDAAHAATAKAAPDGVAAELFGKHGLVADSGGAEVESGDAAGVAGQGRERGGRALRAGLGRGGRVLVVGAGRFTHGDTSAVGGGGA